jgi:hypothetical protein
MNASRSKRRLFAVERRHPAATKPGISNSGVDLRFMSYPAASRERISGDTEIDVLFIPSGPVMRVFTMDS